MVKLYLKQSWMLIRQNKLFSGLYIAGTGLAIAMTMIIAIVYYIKVAPIYPETNRTLTMKLAYAKVTAEGTMYIANSSYEVVRDWWSSLKSAELVTAVYDRYSDGSYVQTESDAEQIPVVVKYTDPRFFRLFEFEFMDGKPYSDADFESGIHSAVLTESMARRIFGETEVTGRTFSLDYSDYKVSGVVRDGSYLMSASYAQIYLPYTCCAGYERAFENSGRLGAFSVYFKVRKTSDMQALSDEMNELVRKYNLSQTEYKMSLLGQPDPYWCSVFRKGNNAIDWMGVLKLYGGIFLALLLVPTINLSGMISSRMDLRLGEMGVRKAFGASRRWLLSQVLWENLLLTGMGGVLGLVLSWALLGVFRNWLFSLFENYPDAIPEGIDVAIEPQMLFSPLLFCLAFGVCVMFNLLSALWPAWRSLRKNIVYSLNEKN